MDYVWNLESQNTTSFPEGPFSVDVAALNRLSYAVDSTWISHTFAVTFLVLCYIRGTVDGQMTSLYMTQLLRMLILFYISR